MPSREQGFATLKTLAGSLLVSRFEDYANGRSLLSFTCKQCGDLFWTTSFHYQKSNNAKCCFNCRKKLEIDSPAAKDLFIKQCQEIHGNYYSYDLIPSTFSAKEKITIVCPKHGQVQTTRDTHINKKSGCRKCHIERITNITRSTKTEFIVKANEVHNFRYNYTKADYSNATTPIEIHCVKHGPFFQIPYVHLYGSGCSLCTNTSGPIQTIRSMLETYSIPYTIEKTFDGCIGSGGKRLRFDIYIPEHNTCIEYDGPHHFFPTRYANITEQQAMENYEQQQQNDEIKNVFCETHNIHLLRIPYTIQAPDAIVKQYLLKEQRKEKYIYTYKDLEADTKKLAMYINSFGYERFAIYCVKRGGVPFAIPLSYYFEGMSEFGVVGFQRYDGNDKKVSFDIVHQTRDVPIFVIDDLISSGITMKKVVSALKNKFKKATIHPVVIFGEENDQGIFFLREHPKMWIVFPYEVC